MLAPHGAIKEAGAAWAGLAILSAAGRKKSPGQARLDSLVRPGLALSLKYQNMPRFPAEH